MRTALGLLLRLYSYLFHLLLSIFLIGIAMAAVLVGTSLKLDMLPWEGARLTSWVLGLGFCGLVCVVLAMTGTLRFLFPLWALFVFIMILRGFFWAPYSFSGAESFRSAVWFTCAALIALLGSLSVLVRRKTRR